ncbi:MAG: PCMD domain-containing protein [Paramuribaculum sp.]|nr:PCMD domain-containing protein [Paramuribaculum sp.]
MRKLIFVSSMLLFGSAVSMGQIEPIKYGNFENWITRYIHESSLLGGNTQTLYEVGPTATIDGNKPYVNQGGSPWGTSNVFARPMKIAKGSNAVSPADRPGKGKCAKLESKLEHVKALGFINMDVMVAGSMFLGDMIEPITSTKNPYSNMNMGRPYTKRPKNIVLDYKLDMPANPTRTKATGFGSKKTLPGIDEAAVYMYLQRRWEDENGNIHAKRVGTAGRTFSKATDWVNGLRIPVVYGDCSNKPSMDWLGLRSKDDAYYARNSKGKLVPVIEEGWDSADAKPTHVVLMISAGNGEPFVGTEGLTFYVDNVGFEQ